MEKYYLVSSLVVILIITLLIQLLRLNKEINEKNMRLIQFYLDRRFVSKCIVNILVSLDLKQCYLNLIKDIKDYFQLDDFIVLKGNSDTFNSLFFNEEIKEFLQDEKLDAKLECFHISSKSIITSKGEYRLYIYHYSPENPNNKIICIKKEPYHLNDNAISTLQNLMNLLICCRHQD